MYVVGTVSNILIFKRYHLMRDAEFLVFSYKFNGDLQFLGLKGTRNSKTL